MIAIRFSAILFFIFISLCGHSQQQWQILEEYEISFSTSKAEGTFKGLDGEISFDPENLASSSFDVSVKVSTISTGNDLKDKHDELNKVMILF